MCRLWAMAGLAVVLSAGNFGCYLDQLQAEQRANRVLQEDLTRARADLADAESLNKQKDTQIDGLSKELDANKQQVASLNVENTKLRDSLASAEETLRKMAGKPGTGSITIVRNALPERLSNALKNLAEQYPDFFEFDPKTGAVRWKADLLFPLGSDQMTTNPELLAAMKKFAEIVNSADAAGFDVVVVGHTCTTPIRKAETRQEHKTNWHLSCHRAIALMNLLSENNVDMGRMGVMGYGEHRPIADNATAEGKSRNRRVEIYLVPKDSVQSFSQGMYKSSDDSLAFMKPSELPGAGEGKPARKSTRGAAKPTAKAAPKPAAPPAEADK